jgi:hypothetical protein
VAGHLGLDFLVMTLVFTALVMVAARLYPGLAH